MSVLRTRGIGVAWAASLPILENVEITLDHGLYGLVGANGAGKTTLLRVLAGELTPHEGQVVIAPRDAQVVYCPQRVDALVDDVAALARRDDRAAAQIRGRLTLDAGALSRWPTLSPGERKRWQIAAALAREPDVLLLDEPTNHLDAEARARLLDALGRFRGTGVVVSHDRAVLDALTHTTIRVHDRRVTLHPGPYGEARRQWLAARASEEAAHAAARAHVRRTEARLDAARRTHASASSATSTRKRMKNRHDHDARGMLATTRAGWAEARAGRDMGIARDELTRARDAVPRIERDRTLGKDVFARFVRAKSPVLFHVDAPALHAGDRVVLRDVRLSIGREDRVRIEGANGAGKTTLLEALRASRPATDEILHLPQELEPGVVDEVLGRLRGDPVARGHAFTFFAALGSDPERVLRGDPRRFSPGEARKLVLAEALAREVWALMLDEPTNHMDLPSVERLETALAAYPGCVVLVTHDDAFAEAVGTRPIRLVDGTLC